MIIRRSRLEVFMLNFRLAVLAATTLFLTASAGYTAETEPGYKANVEQVLISLRDGAHRAIWSADQQRASADVPPFPLSRSLQTSIRIGSRTSYSIRTQRMPELPLSRTAADDIAAYIGS